MALLECPLCTFSVLPTDDYVLQLHFEQVHTEDSPFRIEDDPEPLPPLPPRPSSNRLKHVDEDAPSDSEDENSVLCPEPDCGEVILLSDFNDHLDLHSAATLSFDETTGKYHSQQPASMKQAFNSETTTTTNTAAKSKDLSFLEQNFNTGVPDALRHHEDSSGKMKKKAQRGRGDSIGEKSTLSRSIAAFNPFTRLKVKAPQNTARLGRSELGPHAWEDRMPKWLHDQLAKGPKVSYVNRIGRDGRLIKQEQVQNETPGIIPVLAQLSALDRSVKQAYYCHPSVLHIGKTPKEGGFCGYRNIQMLISYVQGAHAQGHEEFPGRTPGILKLQDIIERAWDKGINEIGRQQTGGIRDTRKYIGTPEAQALFLTSEIDCAVELFTDSPDGQIEAHEQLLYAVESYFTQAAIKEDGSNVCKTLLPPIYLQQPGHSITIIGFERRKDGKCNLVVLDPMYHTSPAMHSLLGRKNIRTFRPEVLHAYRRGGRQLGKHAAFEILMLTAFPPMFPAWDVIRQFPDCRYVYAFFRSKTLGYDVYPEDHFLKNFPWHQYGALWIVDDARFARAEKMNPLTVQALLRITSEGAAPALTMSGVTISASSSNGSFNHGSFTHSMDQMSSTLVGMRSAASTRVPSFMSSFDGSQAGVSLIPDSNSLNPVLNMIGMHTQQNHFISKPELCLHIPQVPFITRNPGFPTPLSPTPSARRLFPSPASDVNIGAPVPRAGTPMSVDGSEMCGPSRRCTSHSYERYVGKTSRYGDTMGITGSPKMSIAPTVHQGMEYVPQAKRGGVSLASSPRSESGLSISPTSPPRAASPRTAMLKNMFGKQALQNMSHNPSVYPIYPTHPSAILSGSFGHYLPNGLLSSSPSSHAYPLHSSPISEPSSPVIEIANGTETSTVSPISPCGTMLRYTSHRPVESGLLALRPLSEAQVAEYRFWRPCGRSSCAIGCGAKDEGEIAAAKRLFKKEEEVKPEPLEEGNEWETEAATDEALSPYVHWDGRRI